MLKANSIELSDLSLAEFYDLEVQLKNKGIKRLAVEGAPSARFGILDPVSATIVLTKLAIPVIALWIAKNRDQASITYSEETRQADGSTRIVRKTVKFSTDSSDAKVVRQLSEIGLDLDHDE